MLPCDTAARRAKVAISIGIQSTLDGHMGPRPAATKKVKYSAETFQDAAVKWIIATDQVNLFLCSSARRAQQLDSLSVRRPIPISGR